MRPIRLAAWPELSPAARLAVRALRIDDRQLEYAGTVERAVAQCDVEALENTGDVVGLALLVDDEVAGFLLLKRRTRAPAWAHGGSAGASPVVVSAMRIDAARQGQGVGSAALVALPGWIAAHWPGADALLLTVDEDNAAGRRAYAKAGFVERGERTPGRIGWVRTMALPLVPAQAQGTSLNSVPAR